MQLIRADVVIGQLGLNVGRQTRAQRQAKDRMWEKAQEIRRETGSSILTRAWLGKRDRYGYPSEVVEELIRTLLSST
jgi:hypothetical protein